jgi:dCMP deaminase
MELEYDNISIKKLTHLHERALTIAAQSHDIHTKVAALLINSKTLAVCSDGYNGFVRGAKDELLPTSRPEKYSYMIHAEANLLCNAVRNGVKTDGCFVYVTISPCTACLRLMWQAGISEFYFKEKYKDFETCTNMLDLKVELWRKNDFYHMYVQTR